MIRGLMGALGAGVGLATLTYLAFVAVRGSSLLVRPQARPFLPDPPDAPATPADLGMEYESVRIRTDDDVTLTGWLVPARRSTTTAVVVMHGFSGNRLPELAAFVPWLSERHHVLQFDFRGHGQSDGGLVTLGWRERRDVAAAVRFLSERGLGPIALFGISMGGAIALVSAPELPVAAVIADAAFAELRHPIANRMRQVGYPLASIGSRLVVAGARLRARAWLNDPIRAVAHIAPRALLLIAPRDDTLISWRQSERMYHAAGEPRELWVVDNAGHAEAYAVDPVGYRRRVLEFLERHLAG